jgi:hypothetical protein
MYYCKIIVDRRLLIALVMEAARTSETLVENYFTRQYIPQDRSELHTRRRENLKSHKWLMLFKEIIVVCSMKRLNPVNTIITLHIIKTTGTYNYHRNSKAKR